MILPPMGHGGWLRTTRKQQTVKNTRATTDPPGQKQAVSSLSDAKHDADTPMSSVNSSRCLLSAVTRLRVR